MNLLPIIRYTIYNIRYTKYNLQAGFIRLSKRAIVTYLIGTIIVTGTGLLYLFNPFTAKKTEAAWFNDNWGYRKAVTLTITSSASDISNLQTLLTVDTDDLITAGQLQSSCQDLRFTSQTSGNILPYYIDSGCNGNSTKVWVMADLVPKNTTTYTVYMYYGNPSAPAGSNSQPWFDNVVGLKGYWTLNDNTGTNAKDSSITAADGTLTNSPSWTGSGKYSNAVSLAGGGTNDYVDLTDKDNFTPTNAGFTVEAWVNYSSFQNNGSQTRAPIVSKSNITGTGSWEWGIEAANYSGTTNPTFVMNTTNSSGSTLSQAAGTTVASASTWYHVVGTVDSSGVARVYVNGVLEATGSSAAFPSNTTETMKIGTSYGASVRWNTNGIIDDVKIYNNARTAAQISNDYNNKLPNNQTLTASTTAPGTIVPSTQTFATAEKAPSPVAYWKFDDGTGTTANDSTTNNSDGTLSGSTVPSWQKEDLCVSGKCLFFDGSTSYITQTLPSSVKQTNITVAAWVRLKVNNALQMIAYLEPKGAGNDGRGIYLAIDANGKISFAKGGATGSFATATGSTTVSTNTWHYIAVTFNGSVMKVYLDGIEDGSTSDSTAISWTDKTDVQRYPDPAQLYIGAGKADALGSGATAASDWFFSGFMDEAKIYPNARSAEQVKADYNARSNPEGVATQFSQGLNNQPGALSNGLVGYWKMDEASGNATDSSGNSFTLTNNGTTTYTAGKFGNGPSLNGSSKYFSCTDGTCGGTSNLDIGSRSWSVSAWFKTSATGVNQMMITKGTTADYSYQLYVDTDNKVQYNLVQAGGLNYLNATSTSTYTDGNWHHAAGVFDATTLSVTLYIDGANVASSTSTSGTLNTNSAAAIEVGRRADNVGYFNGTLDEARVYARSLSPSEVSQLYNFAPGPAGYWKMDENSGNANDSSGNAYTLTNNSTATFNAGKFGNAATLNGSTQFFSVSANSAIQSSNDFTIGMWFKTNNLTDYSTLFSDAGSVPSQYDGREIRILTNAVNFATYNYGTNCSVSTGTISTGTWYYITATRTNGNTSVYLNGALAATCTTASAYTASGDTLNFGRYNISGSAGGYFNGNIDDVKIYNYARSADQIVSDMNAGHPAVGSPVGSALLHWKFDEGYSTTANNSGSGGSTYNGTLTNSPTWTQSGKFGKALTFTRASSTYVTKADNYDLDIGTGSITVTFWTKSSAFTDASIPISKGRPNAGCTLASSTGYEVRQFATSYRFDICYPTGSLTGQASSPTFTTTDDAWHHIAAVFDRSAEKMRVYVDGNPGSDASTSFSTNDINGSDDLAVGGRGYSGEHFFSGNLDDVKIYKYALNTAQVRLDMSRTSAQVLGALSDDSDYQKQAAAQEYCIPGDSSGCDGTDTPIGRWDFEEGSGTTANDTSGNGKTGTISGAAYSAGKYGKALSFDGTDDKVEPTSLLGSIGTGSMTFEAWIKPDTFDNLENVFSNQSADASNGFSFLGSTTNNIRVFSNDATITTSANNSISLGSWNHIAFVRSAASGTASITIYINGKTNGTGDANNYSFTTTGTERIGTAGAASPAAARYFDGLMDQVQIFNYARTSAQIAWDYNRAGPVAHWKMDECQGTILNDSSGGGASATLSVGGTGSQSTPGTCITPTDGTGAWYNGVTGKKNYSLKFDGTDDIASLGTSSPLRQDYGVTYSFWAKIPSGGGGSAFGAGAQGGQGYGGVTVGAANIIFSWTPTVGGSGSDTTLTASTTISDDTWYHIVVAMDFTGTNCLTSKYIYVNGVSLTATLNKTPTSCAPISSYSSGRTDYIGGRYVNSISYFNGTLDDIRVFNHVLTANQVKNLYNEGAVRFGPTTGAP